MLWIFTILLTYVVGGLTLIPLLLFSLWYLSPLASTDSDRIEQLSQELEEKKEIERGEAPGYRSFKAGEVLERENSDVKAYYSGWLTVTKELYQFPQIDPDDFKQDASGGEIDLSSNGSSSTSSFMKIIKGGSSKTKDELQPQDDPASLDTKKLRAIRKKNRYFAVLKHGNLFLYSDEDKKDVRHVIVMNHYLVTTWPRNVSDGQLFSKRVAICLLRRSTGDNHKTIIETLLKGDESTTLPKGSYFLCGDLNHQKEDWYFALLRAGMHPFMKTGTEKDLLETSIMAKPLHFKTADMVDLFQTINSTEGQLTTKWINALIGRLFLTFYQTEEFRSLIKSKVEERLNKIRTPGFLDDILIEHIDVGNSAPFITSPKFNSLASDGDTEIEFNILYQGGLSITLATKLFLFNKREFEITLKLKLKKLHGDVILKIKPPPSNRLWYAFKEMADIDFEIEPVLSSRALNYNLITNIIQNKFKEAIKTSLVMPFMDDFVLYKTTGELFRGGIWDKRVRISQSISNFKHATSSESSSSSHSTNNQYPFPVPNPHAAPSVYSGLSGHSGQSGLSAASSPAISATQIETPSLPARRQNVHSSNTSLAESTLSTKSNKSESETEVISSTSINDHDSAFTTSHPLHSTEGMEKSTTNSSVHSDVSTTSPGATVSKLKGKATNLSKRASALLEKKFSSSDDISTRADEVTTRDISSIGSVRSNSSQQVSVMSNSVGKFKKWYSKNVSESPSSPNSSSQQPYNPPEMISNRRQITKPDAPNTPSSPTSSMASQTRSHRRKPSAELMFAKADGPSGSMFASTAASGGLFSGKPSAKGSGSLRHASSVSSFSMQSNETYGDRSLDAIQRYSRLEVPGSEYSHENSNRSISEGEIETGKPSLNLDTAGFSSISSENSHNASQRRPSHSSYHPPEIVLSSENVGPNSVLPIQSSSSAAVMAATKAVSTLTVEPPKHKELSSAEPTPTSEASTLQNSPKTPKKLLEERTSPTSATVLVPNLPSRSAPPTAPPPHHHLDRRAPPPLPER